MLNTEYKTTFCARVYTIVDPYNEGTMLLEKVLQESQISMRVSAHPFTTTNYSYF